MFPGRFTLNMTTFTLNMTDAITLVSIDLIHDLLIMNNKTINNKKEIFN